MKHSCKLTQQQYKLTCPIVRNVTVEGLVNDEEPETFQRICPLLASDVGYRMSNGVNLRFVGG